MTNLRIEYFAVLREAAGKKTETFEASAGETAASLYEKLAERYHFKLRQADVRVAINDEFAEPDTTLRDGDKIVFIPPVAGG